MTAISLTSAYLMTLARARREIPEHRCGLFVFVVMNQAGVAPGFYTEDEHRFDPCCQPIAPSLGGFDRHLGSKHLRKNEYSAAYAFALALVC
jgi:hypothetical protein